MNARTQVLLADDHAILRAGLAMLVRAQPDLEVVGEAADGIEALEKIRKTKPDVVILDLTMPRMNGFDALREIVRDIPQTKVLVLTMHDDPAYGRSLLAAGALGYVTKKAADRELLTAIRTVREGRQFVDVTQAEDMLPKFAARLPASRELLSQRERQVLALLARGHTHQEVADRLTLSIKTVETYLSRLTRKLGLHRRAELVRYALETGILEREIVTE
ncbi:MAG TPA: response regulator transcription factor [Gemmatimonadales bacterium]|nr:response regulator transcription factor [Gemmatimonadales bacterium]